MRTTAPGLEKLASEMQFHVRRDPRAQRFGAGVIEAIDKLGKGLYNACACIAMYERGIKYDGHDFQNCTAVGDHPCAECALHYSYNNDTPCELRTEIDQRSFELYHQYLVRPQDAVQQTRRHLQAVANQINNAGPTSDPQSPVDRAEWVRSVNEEQTPIESEPV